MGTFKTTDSGIIVPQLESERPVGVRCGYCPYVIFKENEARGRLFIYKDRPICARCRILKTSRAAGRIKADRPKYERDVRNKEARKEKSEVERVAKIAVDSQKRVEKVDSVAKTDRKRFNV